MRSHSTFIAAGMLVALLAWRAQAQDAKTHGSAAKPVVDPMRTTITDPAQTGHLHE